MKDKYGSVAEKPGHLVNDLHMRENDREQRKGERERGKCIRCPQLHTTLLSMLRGQSSDEPTTQTREGEEKGWRTNMSTKGIRRERERVDYNTRTEGNTLHGHSSSDKTLKCEGG